MAFTLPTQTDAQTETETETETEDETVFGGERVEDYEDYWKTIDMIRLLKKSCKALGVAKKKDKGRSPWADHYCHFDAIAYGDDENEGLKQKCASLDGNLPTYKDEFEEPEGEFDKITKDNCEDFGLPADSFGEDEDPIFVPVDYEAPEEVWYQTEGEEVETETVKETFETVNRVGDATSDELLEAIEEAGMKVVWA
ncbi:hypothetical protein [Haloferax larsenii]|uniref:Uncharacterized protein n=1 Tax=Haloferax larsenii TaxID=302484 RepID=A0A1H7N666_HALLR|nr:hypothetical protein [Haloferax larsenii]SEL18377.1 hypothetical protein SAMN04488691_103188 [Haloferax larsenii]